MTDRKASMPDVPLQEDGTPDWQAILHTMTDPQWERRIPMLKALYVEGQLSMMREMAKY